MKKKKEFKKFTIEKFTVAKLKDMTKIKGGVGGATEDGGLTPGTTTSFRCK